MAKANYTIELDGSITFDSGDISDEVREKAYKEAARQRAAATNVDPSEVEQLAAQSAASAHREKATEVTP